MHRRGICNIAKHTADIFYLSLFLFQYQSVLCNAGRDIGICLQLWGLSFFCRAWLNPNQHPHISGDVHYRLRWKMLSHMWPAAPPQTPSQSTFIPAVWFSEKCSRIQPADNLPIVICSQLDHRSPSQPATNTFLLRKRHVSHWWKKSAWPRSGRF